MRLEVGAESRHRIGLNIFPEGPNGERRQGMFVLVSEPELLDALNATKVEKYEAARKAGREAADQCDKAEERLALVEEAMYEAYNVRGDWMEKAGAEALRNALLRAVAHGDFVLPTQPGVRFTATVARQGYGRVGDVVTFETVLGREVMYWKGPGYMPATADEVMSNYSDHSLTLPEDES